MNTNPNAKRIVIFGDSNTWGDGPEEYAARFGTDVRYPGVMQHLLGEGYEIIEEGLPGRTITASNDDYKKRGMVGMEYIRPCIASHLPFNLLILNLGTNEYKDPFRHTAEDVARHLEEMLVWIAECGVMLANREESSFSILVLSPGYVADDSPYEEFSGTAEVSKDVAKHFAAVVEKYGHSFLDLGPITEVGVDGVHYTPEAHTRIADALVPMVRELCA